MRPISQIKIGGGGGCGNTCGGDTHLSANWPLSERLSPLSSGLGSVVGSVVVVIAVTVVGASSPVGGGSSGLLVVELVPFVARLPSATNSRQAATDSKNLDAAIFAGR